MAKTIDPNIDGEADTLFCIADGQLLICTLDHAAKTVPRRIDTRAELDTESDPIRRLTRPFIEFVEPDTQHGVSKAVDVSEDGYSAWRPHGAALYCHRNS